MTLILNAGDGRNSIATGLLSTTSLASPSRPLGGDTTATSVAIANSDKCKNVVDFCFLFLLFLACVAYWHMWDVTAVHQCVRIISYTQFSILKDVIPVALFEW
jgi:hypothetical protein